MRALISGAAGFIGTHLASALAHDGVDVVMVDRDQVPRPPITGNTHYVVADILNSAAICSAWG